MTDKTSLAKMCEYSLGLDAGNLRVARPITVCTILIKELVQLFIISLLDFGKLCLKSSYLFLQLQQVAKFCVVIKLALHHLRPTAQSDSQPNNKRIMMPQGWHISWSPAAAAAFVVQRYAEELHQTFGVAYTCHYPAVSMTALMQQECEAQQWLLFVNSFTISSSLAAYEPATQAYRRPVRERRTQHVKPI